MRERLVVGLGLAAALLVGVGARRLADRCQELVVARLAAGLGPAVKVREVAMSPLGLSVRGIEAQNVAIERALLSVSPWSLLVGRVSIASVELDGITAHLTTSVAPIAIGCHRLVLGRTSHGWHGVAFELATATPLVTSIEELSFDLAAGKLERAAFVGGSVEHPWFGAIHKLQGQLRGAGPTELKGRIAAPGLEIDLIAHEGERKAVVRLDRLLLEPSIGRGVLEQPPQLGGTVEILQSTDGPVQIGLGLQLSGMVLRHRLLSAHAVGPINLQLGGDLGLADGALASNALVLRSGGATVELQGRVSPKSVRLSLRLPKSPCGVLLESMPQGFVPRLASLPLQGEVAARFGLAGDWASIDENDVTLEVDFGCKTIGEAPLGDPTRLGPLGAAPPEGVLEPRLQTARFAPLAVVPGPVIRALLESEDSRFFSHPGFDVPMLRRALAQNLQARRLVRGASTLSQQLVKNLYLSGERTLERKLEEAFLTWRLEATTKKARILELYLNIVDFGDGQRGIAQAARHYYNRPTSELTIDQAVELVSLLPAPNRGRDGKWQERTAALRARLGLPRQDPARAN